MLHWFWLALAVIAEIVATLALKASDGFTRIYPICIVIIGYGVAFIALSKVLQALPVAIIYAIWSGLGISLIAIISWVFFGEDLGYPEIVGILLIITGIVVLKSFSKTLS